jgi:hypothetical protein
MKSHYDAPIVSNVDLSVPLVLSDLVYSDALGGIRIEYLGHEVPAAVADERRYLIVGIKNLFIE